MKEKIAALEKPVVAFAATQTQVRDLATLPRWAGWAGGATSGKLSKAVADFNDGKLDGLALTFGAGSMGFRLPTAKTLVLIGTAHEEVMAQACARAPQAKTVLL